MDGTLTVIPPAWSSPSWPAVQSLVPLHSTSHTWSQRGHSALGAPSCHPGHYTFALSATVSGASTLCQGQGYQGNEPQTLSASVGHGRGRWRSAPGAYPGLGALQGHARLLLRLLDHLILAQHLLLQPLASLQVVLILAHLGLQLADFGVELRDGVLLLREFALQLRHLLQGNRGG